MEHQDNENILQSLTQIVLDQIYLPVATSAINNARSGNEYTRTQKNSALCNNNNNRSLR